MSLIHEALKEMDTPSAAATAAAQPGGWRTAAAELDPRSTSIRPAAALVALAVIALVGVAAAWRYLPKDAAVAPAAPVVPQTTANLPATPVVTPQAVTDAQGAPETSTTTSSVEPVVVQPAPHPSTGPRRTKRSAARSAPRSQPVKAALLAEMPVDQRYALLAQALNAGDMAAAKSHLAELERALPAESVTLLRARAWYASRAGDVVEARKSWQAVLERLPGDENAGLNLAALDAREGRIDAARSLLADVLTANPDSVAAQRALRRLKEGTR